MAPDPQLRRRFEQLVSDVHEPVWRYLARRMPRQDAEDVMSDVLLTLWRRIDDIPASATLPWCYAVARRAAANHHRGGRRRLALADRLQREPAPAFDPEGRTEHPLLADALSRLSPADREVVTLWAWEGLEPREIARVLDITPNAVSVRLSRIKTKLADAMRKDRPASGHIRDENTGDRP